MKRSCLCTFWSSCRCHWNHCGFLHVVPETVLFKFHYSDDSFCHILTILLFLCRRLVVSDLGEVLNETDHIRPRYLQCTVCVSLCTLYSVLCTLYSVLCIGVLYVLLTSFEVCISVCCLRLKLPMIINISLLMYRLVH